MQDFAEQFLDDGQNFQWEVVLESSKHENEDVSWSSICEQIYQAGSKHSFTQTVIKHIKLKAQKLTRTRVKGTELTRNDEPLIRFT